MKDNQSMLSGFVRKQRGGMGILSQGDSFPVYRGAINSRLHDFAQNRSTHRFFEILR